MSMLAVIPARGGSKGVPRKNIKEICGIPLIGYSIIAAINSKLFDKIIVSTDDEEIAELAKRFGAEVPFLRPQDISNDQATSDDVMLHAIQYYEDRGIFFEEICKLQPTSPLRTYRHIREAYSLYKEKNCNYTVSVCECEHSPLWSGVIGEDKLLDNFISDGAKRSCRQQMDKYYRLNGAIYLGKVENFKKEGTFLGQGCLAYIMSQEESVDIDSMLDFKVAEILMRERKVNVSF